MLFNRKEKKEEDGLLRHTSNAKNKLSVVVGVMRPTENIFIIFQKYEFQ